MEQQTNNADNSDAKSFKLYTGKAPLLLQIIGGLMWLAGIGMILQGIPMLIFFGFGILPIILGILNIKYAKVIFKMQKKGFKGTLILQGIIIALSMILWITTGFTSINQSALSGILYALLVSGVLYLYREKFIN